MGYITTNLKLDTDIRQDKIFTTFQRGEHLGRQLCISIYANGAPFLSDNVSRFRLQFDKEDKTSIVAYASSTNASINPHYTYDNKEGYQIFYDVPNSVVTTCGILHCKISIISAQDVTLKTCLFKIRVEDGMAPDNEIVYGDTEKTLEQLFKEFDKGATSIETVGNGNAVTKASYNENSRKITLTKEKQFALSSDISDAFVNVGHSNGVLTFGNKKDAPDQVDISSLLDGIAPYQEVTQAEYDSLSQSEKTNGAVYFIKDAVSNIDSSLINTDIYGEKQLSLNNGVKENTIKIIDGTYSAAIGAYNTVDSECSIAIGHNNKLLTESDGVLIKGEGSAAIGDFNSINSTNSATIGRENHIVDGNTSFLSGEANYSTQAHDFCFGYNLRAYSPNQFVCGVNNEEDTESKYMFIVGNGVDDEGFFDAVYDSNGNEMTDEHGNALTTNQKNIFTIDRKGNVDITGDYYDAYGRKPFHYYSFDGINQTECYIVIPDEKWNKTLPTENCPFYFNFSNNVSSSDSNGLTISFYRNSYRDPDGYSGNHCIVDRNYNPIKSISTGAHLFLWEPNKKINNISGCFVLLENNESEKYEHPKYTARSKGLYKIASDGTGHVLEAEPVTKNDIAALGFATSEGVENAQNVNLLVASRPNVTTANYNVATFGFAEEPKDGEKVTVILKGSLGNDRTMFAAYMGGMTWQANLQDIGSGYYSAVFTWRQGKSNDREFRIYQTPSSGASASTIEWVKLVRGETASKEWSDGVPNKFASVITLNGSAGWRRIAKYNARGGVNIMAGAFTVTVGRNYSANNNEIHKAQIAYTHNQSFKIVNLLDKCNTRVMTKLRAVYDSKTGENYIDLYYNSSGSNTVYVQIDEGEIPTDGCWVPVPYELVTDESSLSVKAEAELPSSFDASLLAKSNGSNASGTWGINVTGNAATATKATQDGNGNNIADTYALKSIYDDTVVNAGRKSGTYVGSNSFAFGTDAEASGDNSHAEGDGAAATDECAHAEGKSTTASQPYAHAEGYETIASGQCAHTEGELSKASGHAAHAEGEQTEARGSYSHAEGEFAIASGSYSHAEGCVAIASGDSSHAEGRYTTSANKCSHAGGHYNVGMTTGGEANNTVGHALAIGNGTNSSARSNAFSVMFDGTVKAAKTITASTSADYAEFFEWQDGNPDGKDRVGLFATLDGDKIRIADEGDDYILGIVSGQPFVLGNGDCDTWNGMHLRDEFGRIIYEPAPKTETVYIDGEGNRFRENEKFDRSKIVNMEEETAKDANGNVIYEGERPVINPDYDPNQTYVSRFERPEWSPVGMLGVLAVYDDGTCKVNGYCRCGRNGIATNAENGYKVIERVADNIVKIVFR